ncbi:hypothetical protein V6281_23780 [Enterobacter asburiae]|jgi:hypothetical protein|uniref:hypothetical protein n=1 Tax=Enterobacter asburiae TaxID=61645 RepID=UPI003B841611
MARKETIHNNQIIQNELRFISFSSLSTEAKKVMREIIQESTFLGKHRVPEEDVFAIVKNAPEFSETMVFEHLKLFRQNKNQNYPDSKSSREKYKRIATLVSQAFEVLVQEGKSLNRMKQFKPKKTVTEEHVALVELLKDEGADLITLIERLIAMNK